MDIRLKYGAENPKVAGPDCVSELLAALRPEASCSMVALDKDKYIVRILLPAGVPYTNLSGKRWSSEHDSTDISDQFEADIVVKIEPTAIEKYEMLHDNVSPEFREGIAPGSHLDKEGSVPIGPEEDVRAYWCALRNALVQRGILKGIRVREDSDFFVVENPLKPLSDDERRYALRAREALKKILDMVKPPSLSRPWNIEVSISDDPRTFRMAVGGSPLFSIGAHSTTIWEYVRDEPRNLLGWKSPAEMAAWFEEWVKKWEHGDHEEKQPHQVRHEIVDEEEFVVENPWNDPRSPI